MTELKPCPFCGSAAERKFHRKYRKGYVATVGCVDQLCPAKIEQATIIGSPEYAYKHAEAAWNQRAKHDKWSYESVWIYRNDRGDIMRAQDKHPAAASEEVEKIYRSDKHESESNRL